LEANQLQLRANKHVIINFTPLKSILTSLKVKTNIH